MDSPRIPQLRDLYSRFLEDRNTVAFMAAVSRRYTQGTLQRLAESDSPEMRRAAVLTLGLIGDYEANHSLGRALQDEDRSVRMMAETAIRNVWNRLGSEEDRRSLAGVVRLNAAQHYEEAVRRASDLLQRAPWFAEVWNQRAIAQFSLGRYSESVHDCHQTLEINPYHFAAAAGMGQAYLEQGNVVAALEGFRRALRLNPNLEAVRVQIARLTRMIEDK